MLRPRRSHTCSIGERSGEGALLVEWVLHNYDRIVAHFLSPSIRGRSLRTKISHRPNVEFNIIGT